VLQRGRRRVDESVWGMLTSPVKRRLPSHGPAGRLALQMRCNIRALAASIHS